VLSVVRKELTAGGTTQPEAGGAEVVTLWLLKVMPKAAEPAQNINAKKNRTKDWVNVAGRDFILGILAISDCISSHLRWRFSSFFSPRATSGTRKMVSSASSLGQMSTYHSHRLPRWHRQRSTMATNSR